MTIGQTRTTLATAVMLGFAACSSAFAQDAIHVTQADAIKAATTKAEPEYPAMAKQLHLEGAVQLQAHIGEDGAVESVKALTGNAVLMNAAISAIKRWKFTPFMADGKPTKAVADLSFKFKL